MGNILHNPGKIAPYCEGSKMHGIGAQSQCKNRQDSAEEQSSGRIEPTYYTTDLPDHSDYINANNSWKLITENNDIIRANICKKKHINITCMNLFYESFYNKLFSIFPETKKLFKNNIHHQGNMLMQMITILLEYYYNKDILKKLTSLVEMHISFGLKSYHFYIAGDILLYSLDSVFMDYFTIEYYDAWRKLYSSMLQIIIPIIKKNESATFGEETNKLISQYSYSYDAAAADDPQDETPEKQYERYNTSDLIEDIMHPVRTKTFVFQTIKKNTSSAAAGSAASSDKSGIICEPKDIFSPNVSFIEPTII